MPKHPIPWTENHHVQYHGPKTIASNTMDRKPLRPIPWTKNHRVQYHGPKAIASNTMDRKPSRPIPWTEKSLRPKNVKDSGHHISPQWYDIVHFGPKPSWICSWALPQKASYQWRYLSILIYPSSFPLLINVGLCSYTQQSSP